VVVPERGQPSNALLAWPVSLRVQRVVGGVEVTGVPQHDRVEDQVWLSRENFRGKDQAERGELVFLALSVGLADLAACAMADRAGELVPGLLHRGLGVDRPAVREPVNFLGRYTFDPGNARPLDDRRPLRSGAEESDEVA